MKFFTVNQLAEYFGVNPRTIYRRLWEKGIPAFKIGRILENCEEGYQMVGEIIFQE